MHPTLNIALPELEWIGLLRDQIAKGRTISALSRECGIARASLSMLLSGSYPAQSLDLVTRKHGARIVRLYRGAVLCPHLRTSISAEVCRGHASAPMSTSNHEKMKHWEACRVCPLKPEVTAR
ncbi:hypothetical protein [Pseudorhodobacter sp.]|uniref:hypothetical protein n=1 Tax=Pseudorhodobacter sp. TaxID=1934400 RepID=UPI002648303E|nr:hypothetical protein [Pseudorhodobacter sp.]MDN5785720.1 hypothetical protein [Pseudorhodobacter sp.]